ncbi:hypothetical protein K435DRAFT_836955 [Dendrothele bispora CBS 962.96]|uniref:Uncharacterized protein n=1 Tax=Dendrothele bispora (strain CBS 962.96) TaxID=1314807 RepID=A0A4S8MFD3_DENBC|nr:hypothetical protein K435DRAFT_836955 [Dendrothele bispora CBS 962.96]
MSATNCTSAIPSNSDVDGLGIRLATYLQLFIGITTLAISPANGVDSWWAVIITSLALQVAAITDQTLSLYHALIVTWITFPVFIMSFYYGFLAWGERTLKSEIMIGTSLHISLYPGFCMWVWATVKSFGQDTNQCNDQVKFALFTILRPTGWVRYLVMYIVGIWIFAISAMWIGLGALSILLFIAKHNASVRQWWSSTPSPNWKHTPSLNATVAVLTSVNLAALVLAVIMIEIMVMKNSDIIENGGDEWTFGQIIAIILVAGPLLTLVKVILAEYKMGLGHKNESLQGRPAAFVMAKILGRKEHKYDLPMESRSSSSDYEDNPQWDRHEIEENSRVEESSPVSRRHDEDSSSFESDLESMKQYTRV